MLGHKEYQQSSWVTIILILVLYENFPKLTMHKMKGILYTMSHPKEIWFYPMLTYHKHQENMYRHWGGNHHWGTSIDCWLKAQPKWPLYLWIQVYFQCGIGNPRLSICNGGLESKYTPFYMQRHPKGTKDVPVMPMLWSRKSF